MTPGLIDPDAFSRYPLVLPHAQIRRMLSPQTHTMVLSRHLEANAYEVHDEQIIQLNARRKRSGRSDHQDDPSVFVIELDKTETKTVPLLDLDLLTIRRAGFKTLEDFYVEWTGRRRRIVVGLEVKIYTFEIAEDALYLDAKIHRGYTRNPAKAARDEPQVIDRATTDHYARQARERYEAEHAGELARREARSLANQLREAQARAVVRGVDVSPEVNAIRQQLDQMRNKLTDAA